MLLIHCIADFLQFMKIFVKGALTDLSCQCTLSIIKISAKTLGILCNKRHGWSFFLNVELSALFKPYLLTLSSGSLDTLGSTFVKIQDFL